MLPTNGLQSNLSPRRDIFARTSKAALARLYFNPFASGVKRRVPGGCVSVLAQMSREVPPGCSYVILNCHPEPVEGAVKDLVSAQRV